MHETFPRSVGHFFMFNVQLFCLNVLLFPLFPCNGIVVTIWEPPLSNIICAKRYMVATGILLLYDVISENLL